MMSINPDPHSSERNNGTKPLSGLPSTERPSGPLPPLDDLIRKFNDLPRPVVQTGDIRALAVQISKLAYSEYQKLLTSPVHFIVDEGGEGNTTSFPEWIERLRAVARAIRETQPFRGASEESGLPPKDCRLLLADVDRYLFGAENFPARPEIITSIFTPLFDLMEFGRIAEGTSKPIDVDCTSFTPPEPGPHLLLMACERCIERLPHEARYVLLSALRREESEPGSGTKFVEEYANYRWSVLNVMPSPNEELCLALRHNPEAVVRVLTPVIRHFELGTEKECAARLERGDMPGLAYFLGEACDVLPEHTLDAVRLAVREEFQRKGRGVAEVRQILKSPRHANSGGASDSSPSAEALHVAALLREEPELVCRVLSKVAEPEELEFIKGPDHRARTIGFEGLQTRLKFSDATFLRAVRAERKREGAGSELMKRAEPKDQRPSRFANFLRRWKNGGTATSSFRGHSDQDAKRN